jgi:hypothetical protein
MLLLLLLPMAFPQTFARRQMPSSSPATPDSYQPIRSLALICQAQYPWTPSALPIR